MPSFISKGRTGCAEVMRKADGWQGMYTLQRGPSKIVANTRRGDWNLLISGVFWVKSEEWLCCRKLWFFPSLEIFTILWFQVLLVRLRSPKIREINQKDQILEPQWGKCVFRLCLYGVDGYLCWLNTLCFVVQTPPRISCQTRANKSPSASVIVRDLP